MKVFSCGHRKNEGLCITGNGSYVNVRVNRFFGERDSRTIRLEIEVDGDVRTPWISEGNRFELMPGVFVEVSDRLPSSGKVELIYSMPDNYEHIRKHWKNGNLTR